MSDLLRIGQLASLTEISVSTIRYYEQLGLLEGIERTEGGSRRYSQSIIDRLKVIKGLQAMGFSLADMHTFLGSNSSCDNKEHILSTLEQRASGIQNLIETMKQRKESLLEIHHRLKDTWDEGRCLTQSELHELSALIGATE